MTLGGLETLLQEELSGEYGAHIVRYADDFIITANSKALLTDTIMPMVSAFLSERGLTLSKTKTKITRINHGFDLLGASFIKTDIGYVVKPTVNSIGGFIYKIQNIITDHRSMSQIELINQLNPAIRGWANSHKYYSAQEAFYQVDRAIEKALLWKWAKPRHPEACDNMIIDRYFHEFDGIGWTFAAPDRKASNDYRLLEYASDMPIFPYKRFVS